MNDGVDVINAANRLYAEDKNLVEIFEKYLEITEEKNKDNPGYQAWAGMAVHTALALSNIILSAKKTTKGRNLRALCDLSFRLSQNDFWLKNSGFLMPLVILSLNAIKDLEILKEDAKTLQQAANYEILIRGTEVVPLEIFTAILYLVGGEEAMNRLSAPFKQELIPYFLG
jgi:hypothetical protein